MPLICKLKIIVKLTAFPELNCLACLRCTRHMLHRAPVGDADKRISMIVLALLMKSNGYYCGQIESSEGREGGWNE